MRIDAALCAIVPTYNVRIKQQNDGLMIKKDCTVVIISGGKGFGTGIREIPEPMEMYHIINKII